MIHPSTHTLTQIIRLRTHAHITPNFSHFGIGSNSLARITWIENDSNDLLGYNRNVCRRFIIDRMFLIRPVLLYHTRTHIHIIRQKRKKIEKIQIREIEYLVYSIRFVFVFCYQKNPFLLRISFAKMGPCHERYTHTSTYTRPHTHLSAYNKSIMSQFKLEMVVQSKM